MRNGHPELSPAAEQALDTGHRLKWKEPIVAVRNFHTSLSSLHSFHTFLIGTAHTAHYLSSLLSLLVLVINLMMANASQLKHGQQLYTC